MKLMHGVSSAFSQDHLGSVAIFHPSEAVAPSLVLRCPLCRRRVNETAETCQHCGSATREKDDEPAGKGVWVMVILVLIGAMTFSFTVIR